jgi:hypothetical protein
MNDGFIGVFNEDGCLVVCSSYEDAIVARDEYVFQGEDLDDLYIAECDENGDEL